MSNFVRILYFVYRREYGGRGNIRRDCRRVGIFFIFYFIGFEMHDCVLENTKRMGSAKHVCKICRYECCERADDEAADEHIETFAGGELLECLHTIILW
jgi:hypothetical protein